MIKALLFDFGQTLVDSADGFRTAESIAKETIFLDIFPYSNDGQWELFLKEYRQIRKTFHSRSIFSRQAIWQAVYDRFYFDNEPGKLKILETEYWDCVKAKTRPFPETIETLGKLSEKYRLGIVTNTQGQTQAGNHRIGLFPQIEKFFEAIVVAGESDIPPKPHKNAFLSCLNEMGLAPEECLYVGDDLEKDIFGAGYAGLRPVWIQHHTVKRNWPAAECPKRVQVITSLNQLLDATWADSGHDCHINA
jgi:putative hydrolase of the HAD superfamily